MLICALCPRIWSILEELLHAYSLVFEWNSLQISVESILCMMSFNSDISLLIFCSDDLSIWESGLLKLFTINKLMLRCVVAPDRSTPLSGTKISRPVVLKFMGTGSKIFPSGLLGTLPLSTPCFLDLWILAMGKCIISWEMIQSIYCVLEMRMIYRLWSNSVYEVRCLSLSSIYARILKK